VAKRKSTPGQDWAAIGRSEDFQQLVRLKKRFIIPNVVFFLVFYFTLPISTSYFTFLNEKAIGALNWAYLFAFAQFIMTWVLCMVYNKRANSFDEMVERIKEQQNDSKGGA